jgi:predicted helicase
MDEFKTKNIHDIGYYYGGMKQDELKCSETKQIILGTYCMISEGFDVKGLDTLVLASPKSDIVQSVGRILREKPEDRKHIPRVIDIVDDYSLFPKQAKKRRAYYKLCKYNVTMDNTIVQPCFTNKCIDIQEYAFDDDHQPRS